MTWKKVQRLRSVGFRKPEAWRNGPAVTLTKNGVSFNELMAKQFSIQGGDYVNVLIDEEKGRIGIQQIGDGESTADGFKVREVKSKAGTISFTIPNCKQPARVLEKFLGFTVAVKYLRKDDMIVADVSKGKK